MNRFLFALSICVLGVSVQGFSQSAAKKMAAGPPDKALMQKIWDGWATLDPANVAKFYAKGPHVFFDIAPLKYNSWDEYQQGVKNVLAPYQSATLTVNDDAQIHSAGQMVWGTATVKSDLTEKSGKHDLGIFRWTVVWQKQGGQWLIVHEHISAPLQ
ncbi:MAG TPA: nuclear transport factor 2 family protein [Terriglobales bacterium]|nr:nuclear transport factor 2 family protein [Terriglobales bacterium]